MIILQQERQTKCCRGVATGKLTAKASAGQGGNECFKAWSSGELEGGHVQMATRILSH
jgi:hypothetical protein